MFKFKTLCGFVLISGSQFPCFLPGTNCPSSISSNFAIKSREGLRAVSSTSYNLAKSLGKKQHGEIHPEMWHFGTLEKGMLRKKNRIRSSTRTEVEAINFLDFVQLWFLQLGRTIFDQKKAFFTRDQGGLETWRHGTSPGNPYASPTIHRASKKMLM